MNNVTFLISYLIFMTLTYLWRFIIVFIFANHGQDIDPRQVGNIVNIILFINYLILAYITYKRGKAINKGWLVSFPIVGALFDLVWFSIPLVPTIMNIITIVIGVQDENKKVFVEIVEKPVAKKEPAPVKTVAKAEAKPAVAPKAAPVKKPAAKKAPAKKAPAKKAAAVKKPVAKKAIPAKKPVVAPKAAPAKKAATAKKPVAKKPAAKKK